LLSIPAILGANILEFATHGLSDGFANPLFYLVGFVAALISGFYSINMVFNSLAKKKFGLFGIYAIALGLIVIFI